MKGFKLMFLVLGISLAIASVWNSFPVIKETAHSILDPTAGALINWNTNIGFIIVIFISTLFTVLVQKFTTDQKELKKLRQEQKILREEMKKYRNHPEKMLELNKKQLEFIPKTFDLTTKSFVYTAIPFILLFRWFGDFLDGIRFFGFLSWFWFYFILTIILSSILRKILKVY